MKHTALFLSAILCLSACQTEKKAADNSSQDNDIRIAWDYSSMQQIAERGAYPRLLRMQDNSLIAIYETRTGNIEYKRSYDNGLAWSEPVRVFSQFTHKGDNGASTLVNMANAEIIQLKNGDIIAGANYRPAKAEIAPFSIAIRRSTDNGKSWLPEQVLYDAAPRFHDGCWEPSFLQLPDGEVQVYFANENPYQQSDEQEISVMKSKDNGATWGEATMVCFRQNRRDGMPVARIIGDEIVVVIEDNNIDRFKPYTVRTKLSDNWSKPVLVDSLNRNYSLTQKIDDSVYMGAPYLLKLPTGETMISYQTNENRASDWEYSTMEVAIGDKTARNFDRRTRPFDVPLDKEAKWNSLAMWDENTVVAFASSNFKSKEIAPWLIKGYIIPELRIITKDITAYPIFIGAKGETNLRAGLGIDEKNLYITCKVEDKELFGSENSASDGVYIYFNNEKVSTKVWCNYQGNTGMWEEKRGEWQEKPINGIQVTSSIKDNGYELNVIIPKKEIEGSDKKEIKLGMALSAYDAQSGYTEMLVNSEENEPETWLKVKLGN
ncbi:MAG: glycoside hydrolase [Prevotella sp.]|nr:glycoside hydrolase [Prevotella sp.]